MSAKLATLTPTRVLKRLLTERPNSVVTYRAITDALGYEPNRSVLHDAVDRLRRDMAVLTIRGQGYMLLSLVERDYGECCYRCGHYKATTGVCQRVTIGGKPRIVRRNDSCGGWER